MTTAQTRTIRAPLKWAWLAWGIASVLLAIYCAMASIASTAARAEIVLSPGRIAHLPVTSLYGHTLSFELDFPRHAEDARTADLGSWSTTEDRPGTLHFDHPGARIAGTVSIDGDTPIPLEAMPASGYSADAIFRAFSENLPVAPGEWRWPPNARKAQAKRGHNDVVVTITDVDPRLAGETVTLWARPPLSFKSADPRYDWLSPAYFLRPLGLPLVSVAGLVLLYRTWRAYRKAPRTS